MRTLRRLSLAGTAMLVLLSGPGSVVAVEEGPAPRVDGQTIAEMVEAAVASCGVDGCDATLVEAAYAPDIRIVVDGQVRAEGLDEVRALFVAADRTDHSFRLITPVAEYPGRDGGLYVAMFVEVVSPGHPQGDPIVSLLQVRDGKVIRQVDTTPPFGWAAEATE